MMTVDCHDLLSSQTTTINDLPEDVLLEIFDAFRLEAKTDRLPTGIFYKFKWGTPLGWFRLAHVCRKWRSVVLASPSRLDLHLLYTEQTSQSALTCPWLQTLPIFVWCFSIPRDDASLVAAMEYPDRLYRIDITGCWMERIFPAMNRAFPALEVLRVNADVDWENAFEVLQVSAAPNLRVLSLTGVHLSPLSQLLFSATNLVDLELWDIEPTNYLSPANLLVHLQSIPRLRHVKLGFTDVTYYDPSDDSIQRPISSKNAIAASKLVSFLYRGDTAYLEEFVSLLAPPPLEDFKIELFYGSKFAIPGLVRCIRAALAGRSYTVVMARFGQDNSYFLIGDRSGPIVRWAPFKFDVSFTDVGKREVFLARIWGALAASIAPVEELVLACYGAPIRSYRISENRTPWGALLEHFCNVKKLKLCFNLAFELAHFLCAGPGHGEPVSDVLPALEEIELYPQGCLLGPVPTGVVDAFQPFIAARKLAVRTVKVYITS